MDLLHILTNEQPLLHRLHWLRAPEQISFKLAVLAFRCLKGLAQIYLTDSLQHVADLPGRQRLRSASSADLEFRWGVEIITPQTGAACDCMAVVSKVRVCGHG